MASNEIEIMRWSGLWTKERTVRVGVRLKDGRDALLKAFVSSGSDPDVDVVYQLLIKGDEHYADFLIPADLDKAIRAKLTELLKSASRPVSLRDLRLF